MPVHSSIGGTHRTQAKVIRPPHHNRVESAYSFLRFRLLPSRGGGLVDRSTNVLDRLFRRASANIGTTRLGRITSAQSIPQEIHRIFRYRADLGLGLVNRQFEWLHHLLHGWVRTPPWPSLYSRVRNHLHNGRYKPSTVARIRAPSNPTQNDACRD